MNGSMDNPSARLRRQVREAVSFQTNDCCTYCPAVNESGEAADGAVLTARVRVHRRFLLAGAEGRRTVRTSRLPAGTRRPSLRALACEARRDSLPLRV